MIVYFCCYDPEADISPVSVSGFLNLQEAWVNGAVPADLVSSAEAYNGIEDPAEIAGKPRDFADSFRMNKEYSKALASDNNDVTDKSQ